MLTANSKSSHHLNAHSGEVLKNMFKSETSRAKGHMEVCNAVCNVVNIIASSEMKFAFVSGIISGDGPQHIDRNMAILESFTNHLRDDFSIPVMSATDVFHRDLLDQYRTEGKPQWAVFWRKVLKSGVGTLVMTPRWEASFGAIDEHKFALDYGIKIDYRHGDPALLEILRKNKVEYKPDESVIKGVIESCLRPAN